MPLLVLSKWTGTGEIEDAYRLAIRTAYPSLNLSRADESDYSATARAPVYADGDGITLAKLAADPQFPVLSAVPFTFVDYQSAMLAAVQAWYAQKVAAGFTYSNVVYPLDTASLTRWHALLGLTSSFTFPIRLTSADGKTVVSADQATALAAANAAFSAMVNIDQTAAGYCQQIAAAQTTADLDAITIQ